MRTSSSSSTNPSGIQGICPNGWHVPSDAEWTQLTDFVETQTQYQCLYNYSENISIVKALASTTGWNYSGNTCYAGYNPNTNNATGFSVLPAGRGFFNDNSFGDWAYFWSATEVGDYRAYVRYLYSGDLRVNKYYEYKTEGYSVRCLRDATSSVSLPMVTTNTASNTIFTSATCGGNVTSDGGATVTARGVCWSTSQNPTIIDSHTIDGTGMGSFTSSLTGLTPNITYYVRAYATNSVGTVYGSQVSFTIISTDGQPCMGAATVTDYDNNTYNTLQIGSQCWMKENLRTTHYSDGTSIPLASFGTSVTTAYRCYPNNSSSNVSTYGYLYNWKAAMGSSSSSSANPSFVQGICPTGWHVPSDAEWTQLTDYVSSQNQYWCDDSYTNDIAKALASTIGWNSSTNTCAVGNNPNTNNATGFSALPAGRYSGGYGEFGSRSYIWSATEYGGDNAYGCILYYDNSDVSNYYFQKSYAHSVRCVRDTTFGGGETTAFLPTVTTAEVSNITQTSATCGGNVTSDGGATVTARGVCWSTSQNPTVSDSHTTNGSGTFSFTSNITGLTSITTYYVRAYATNSVGTAYGSQVSFTTTGQPQPCPDVATVTDYDNNTYNTVQIGDQCWMKENLRTTHYSNGTSIALGSSTSTSTAYRYYPNNNSSNVDTYGYLYNWKAVMGSSTTSSANPSGVRGICPIGWHVPSDSEWTQLTNYVGSQPQYQCNNSSENIASALASTWGWMSSTETCAVGNTNTNNNATGFSAPPAGRRYYNGYTSFGYLANFWSATESTEYSAWNAYSRLLYYNDANITSTNTSEKYYGFSVRCVKDAGAVITTTVTSVTGNSATCVGEVISDGGAMVTARGVCWSTSQNPTVSDSHTTNGTGIGSFTSTITGLTPVTTYFVRAYATNSEGTAYGNEECFTTPNPNEGQPCLGAATVTDIDNNTYNTVQIGNQCWMKENLRTTRYSNGTSIALGSSSSTSTTTSYRYYPSNSISNVSTYGYLYNWKAVMGNSSSSSANPSGVQGICPTGWHVPSDAEWTQLTDYVSSQTQYQCNNISDNIAKALASTSGWSDGEEYSVCCIGNTPGQNNATGFKALPAGGASGMLGTRTSFWSATGSSNSAFKRSLYVFSRNVDRSSNVTYEGFSVRCVKD
jgi:uncharacterized protein (TIGR02145 family)